MHISELLIRTPGDNDMHGCLADGEMIYPFTLTSDLTGKIMVKVNGGDMTQLAFNASETFPISELEFWKLFLSQKPILTCNTKFGVAEMDLIIVGFNYNPDVFPEAPIVEKLVISHQYRSFPALPSMRRGLKLTWSKDIGVGVMLATVSPLHLEYNFKVDTIHGGSKLHLAFIHQGTTDKRHEAINEKLIAAFGQPDSTN